MSVEEANRTLSFGLVVLIWMVQLIIYPAFADIAADRFARWHAGYTRAISRIVVPLMFAQLAATGWLLVSRPTLWHGLSAGMVAVAWVATFALAVPAHDGLRDSGQDEAVLRRLLAANWIRTAAWTLAFLGTLPR